MNPWVQSIELLEQIVLAWIQSHGETFPGATDKVAALKQNIADRQAAGITAENPDGTGAGDKGPSGS